MARYEHLKLIQLPETLPRRKRPGFGSITPRDSNAHAGRLKAELVSAIETQTSRRQPQFIDPSLILKVKMKGMDHEEDWEQAGLTLLSKDEDTNLVLFSSAQDLNEFTRRLDAYGGEIPPDQKHPPYAGFVSAIETISSISPADRIGIKLKESGITNPEHFLPGNEYYLDIELWDLGKRELRLVKVEQLAQFVTESGGEVFDQYIGSSLTMIRVHAKGGIVQSLLNIDEISSIDIPPVPDLDIGEIIKLELKNSPPVNSIDADAPVIGVIDSGINSHPFLENLIIGSIGVPPELGNADDNGHGTRVAGISIFGDLRSQLGNEVLIPGAKICSAKVVNQHGRFDDKTLVPSQMRMAISKLHADYKCRVFVISLGDKDAPYSGGKIGAWASTLDELARELDVLIVVSAGNRHPRKEAARIEEAVTHYPAYLLEMENGLLEPSAAVNVLTVGSISHGEGVDDAATYSMSVRPITKYKEPSPFTRKGPGVGGCSKPDMVDFGGTYVFDPVLGRLRSGQDLPSAGILSLHHLFGDQLLATGSGTSYSAPMVAYKASQLLRVIPGASANLIRCLLANSATIPKETLACLNVMDEDERRNICGHGVIDAEKAAYSDEARVVFFAEDELQLDHFAVYQIPVPPDYQKTSGKRHINITLAYDPPVRHTRADYAGVSMNFRLIRGKSPVEIFEHYRNRNKKLEGKAPDLHSKYDCKLKPGPTIREKGTLQKASITYSTNISDYGDSYYLVVRCESGWAKDLIHSQKFAVTIELSHEQQIPLYARLTARLKA